MTNFQTKSEQTSSRRSERHYKKSMAAKTRYEDGEIYGVLLPYFCGVEGMEEKHIIILTHDKKATYLLRNRLW